MSDRSSWLSRDADAIADSMKLRFFPVALESQRNAQITDVSGEEYIDLTASWAVSNTGYCHPHFQERVEAQLREATANSALSVPHPPLIELAETLCELTPGRFEKKVWFGHSGSEAGDLISKVVPAAAAGDTIVTFAGSYHGQTKGSAAISGHAATGGGDAAVSVVEFPRDDGPDSDAVLAEVRALLETGDVAGVITEPIQSDAGIYPPPPGFLADLASLCGEYDAYFVVDEVKAGLGRTGDLFACDADGVAPDAMMIGKPLGSGLAISAVVGRPELVDALPAGHMMTTAGNPLSAAAGLATLEIIDEENLVEAAAETGAVLRDRLKTKLEPLDHVRDIRGRGLMQGVELRDPVGDDSTFVAKTCYRARELGVLVFYVGESVLELTPPLTISRQDLSLGVERLAEAIEDVATGRITDEEIQQYSGW